MSIIKAACGKLFSKTGSINGGYILSITLELIFCNQSVCRGKSEYWCLGANNAIALFPQPLPPPQHTVLFEDYVACDMQNCKHYTAIAMEVSCKYNADLPDKMVSLSFL